MTEPEFDHTYLPWSLTFFVCSISIDGPKVLHRLLIFCDIFQPALAKMWSRKEKVVLAIRVGSRMISFKENAWHNSIYLDIKGEFRFPLIDIRLILKSSRK